MAPGEKTNVSAKPQLWPIFICYRRVDGSVAARRLHEMLDKVETNGPDGESIQLDVYLDETMPGVEDWKKLHGPYLEKARAIMVVCTPGAKLKEEPEDWVHLEIDWWLRHRHVAPILVDPLMAGVRYIPSQIVQRWSDIQRIAVVEGEWSGLSGEALEEKATALRRQVLGAILPSGAEVYTQELEEERKRTRRSQRALAGSLLLLLVTVIVSGYALYAGQVARAARLDSDAAESFAKSRLMKMRIGVETSRRRDLRDRIGESEEDSSRQKNLLHELQQISEDIDLLKSQRASALAAGSQSLGKADNAWKSLDSIPLMASNRQRNRPNPPGILSIELLNVGRGECILVYYGTPDDVRVVMINGGPKNAFKGIVQPRLQRLSRDRFQGRPVPIELFVVSDRDEQKTGVLLRLLEHLAGTQTTGDRLVDIQRLWFNIFLSGGRDSKSRINRLIRQLKLQLNKPFDHHVMRPDQGRARVALSGGLVISILGPDHDHLKKLHEWVRGTASGHATVPELEQETFSEVDIVLEPSPLWVRSPSNIRRKEDCVPSRNASALIDDGGIADTSPSNVASLVLLFEYQGKSFLYTGDARGDLILDGLDAAKLLDSDSRAHVDLLSVPHFGSDRSTNIEFFERVWASGYLFSGDGTHGNPNVSTVAKLITARGCSTYRMYFANRDGKGDDHAAKLDRFFERERNFNPNYRRVFRSQARGAVMIDFLDPIDY